jgi:hypothetical protein
VNGPRLPTPSACGWCGIDEGEHCTRWVKGAGWHFWQAPTDEQRKARMLARRAARAQR